MHTYAVTMTSICLSVMFVDFDNASKDRNRHMTG